MNSQRQRNSYLLITGRQRIPLTPSALGSFGRLEVSQIAPLLKGTREPKASSQHHTVTYPESGDDGHDEWSRGASLALGSDDAKLRLPTPNTSDVYLLENLWIFSHLRCPSLNSLVISGLQSSALIHEWLYTP